MIILGEIIFDFSRITSDSTTIAFVGYVIVFLALISLYFVFRYMPGLLNLLTRKRLKRKGDVEEVIDDLTITGEVSAAISAALLIYFNEMHDEEKTVLTITKISRRYSPWSSKIYNVTTGLNRRF